jgi:predicted outer membrane repeat protein
MKKSIFFLTAAAVMLFSCEKEQDFTKVNQDVPEKTISFAVSHETDADASKTTIDSGGNVQWEAADKLGVVYDGGLVESSAAGAPGASASFTATIPGDKDALYLVYPSSITAGYESGSLKVTVPATQDGTFGSTAIQVAEYAQPTCSIKNLGGLLAITTTADVDEIVISSNNSTPLVGKATVSFTDGIPSVSSVESGSTSVTLSGLGGAGTYYVAVLPGSFDAGIYIELKKSGSAVGEKITGNTLNVVRRKIMKINVGDPGVIANKKFVTVAGAGLKDGSSWDNAMGSTEFYSFLINKSTDNTVFMAAGTYPTQAAAGCTFNAGITGLSIYGGYPSTATGTSLAGRDITANRTILSGDQNKDDTGENRILVTNNSNITAVLDGLEFRNAYASGSQGMGSALCINTCKNIKVVNCVFDGNVNVTTTTESAIDKTATGGGAVRAVGGTILFKGCTFSNNTSTEVGGGAMRVGGLANVTLDACVFSNNTAAANGGAIHMNKGTLTIKDSRFNNNTAATNGGAISITQQASCTVNISDTEFYHNRAGSTTGYCGGAIFVGKWTFDSDIMIKDCYFEENEGHATDIVYDPETPTSLKTGIDESKASTGGAIFVEKNASVKLDHCWFYHNLCSKNGGAIRTKDATAVLYMNACSFYMNYSGASASTVQGTSGPIAMYNCVFYNNQNKSTSSPATIRSTNGEILMANTSLRLGSSYPGVVFSATKNSVIVNSLFVNSGAGSEPALKKAIAVASGKTVSSFGHNLHSGYNADGSSYGTIDQTNAMAGSDQEIGLDDFPSWVGTFDGIGYHLLKITKLPTTYYNADPAVDYRATPAEVEAAIEYFDTNNSTAFKTWLNTLDEGSGRKPLDVDYRGYLRNATNIWPGSYEYGATK